MCFRLSLVRENKPRTLSRVFPSQNLEIVFYFSGRDVGGKRHFCQSIRADLDFLGKVLNRIVNNRNFLGTLRRRVRVRLSAVIPEKNRQTVIGFCRGEKRKKKLGCVLPQSNRPTTTTRRSVVKTRYPKTHGAVKFTGLFTNAMHYRPIVHRRHP